MRLRGKRKLWGQSKIGSAAKPDNRTNRKTSRMTGKGNRLPTPRNKRGENSAAEFLPAKLKPFLLCRRTRVNSTGESAKGTAPSAARGTVRESLDSPGSPYH